MVHQHILQDRKIIVILFLLCFLKPVNSAKISPHLDTHWENFKSRYNETYHPVLEKNRRLAWEKNLEMIKKHNEEHEKGMHTYRLKLNHLAALTQRQYLKDMVRLVKTKAKPFNQEITALPHHNISLIPEELDWRKEGFETDPLNQEECGSCYAFSVASCIQGQYFKMHKKIVNFSAQQLVDCSLTSGNLGCAGGSLRNTLKYIQSVGGLMLEKEYPYTAKQNTCSFRRAHVKVKLKTWAILPPKDEHALKIAVATIGPVAVSVNASPATFQLYANGTYDDPSCTSEYVNHAMLLVGYTKKAWILKNWWTDEWGEDGYMMLARGRNRCAVANYAAYTTIY